MQIWKLRYVTYIFIYVCENVHVLMKMINVATYEKLVVLNTIILSSYILKMIVLKSRYSILNYFYDYFMQCYLLCLNIGLH